MDSIGTKEKGYLGSGWAFPITFSIGNLELNLTQYEKNVNDSIDIILQTNKGERCLEPDFGTGLSQFLFKKMDETLKGEIIDAIESSLLHNEPRINVENIEVTYSEEHRGTVIIDIAYVYSKTNTRHNYVFPFYVNEGTNLNHTMK
ncbi:MAG: GPW/gp25 family protein [Flavobacteriaceae bacterium]|nr:GPW/gp25 family protein [Flavobacteriaceae bacterium]